MSLVFTEVVREASKEAAEHGSECELVGEEMADLAGIGVITGFVGQALLSLILAYIVFYLTKTGRLNVTYPEGTLAHRIQSKRIDTVMGILMVGSDLQMLLGVSYLVTVFALHKTVDSYHLHLVFDIASFVGVSNSAAMVCWTFCQAKVVNKDSKWSSHHGSKRVSFLSQRHIVTYIFCAMHLALTIYLCVALGNWSLDKEPGRCYQTNLTTTDGDQHPRQAIGYVVTTAFWMYAIIAGSLTLRPRARHLVLFGAAIQFPLHLYYTIALRYAQKGHFEGEEQTEDGWDFGQSTAVLLLGVAIFELLSKSASYIEWERELEKHGGLDSVESAELNKITTAAAMEEARSRSRNSHETPGE